MINIYYLDTTEAHLFCESDLLKITSDERKEKIKKYVFAEDKSRSTYGEALIKYCAACHHLNFNYSEPFATNQYGKPFFQNLQNFHFNLSHSGKFVLCAISNQNIGVDIEKRTTLDILSLTPSFHPKEIKLMEQKKYQKELFFDIWTLKESYLKYLGIGLSMPLNSFYVDPYKNKVYPHSQIAGSTPTIQLFKINDNYSTAICSQLDEPYVLKKVTLNELYQHLL